MVLLMFFLGMKKMSSLNSMNSEMVYFYKQQEYIQHLSDSTIALNTDLYKLTTIEKEAMKEIIFQDLAGIEENLRNFEKDHSNSVDMEIKMLLEKYELINEDTVKLLELNSGTINYYLISGLYTKLSEFTEIINKNRLILTQAIYQLNQKQHQILQKSLNDIAIFTSIIFPLAIVCLIFLRKKYFIPIDELRKAAKKISTGDLNYRLNLNEGEFGELGITFNRLLEGLQEYDQEKENSTLKLKTIVKEKTDELEKTLTDIKKDQEKKERQQLAMLNILEDMQTSQGQMRILNDDLDRKQKALIQLKSLSDDLARAMDIESAVIILNEYLTKIEGIELIGYVITDPQDDKYLFHKCYLREKVSESFFEESDTDLIKYISKNKNIISRDKQKIISAVLPEIAGKIDNKDNKQIGNFVYCPLSLFDRSLGLIQFVFSKDSKEKEIDRDILLAMSVSFSQFIDRLFFLLSSQQSRTLSLIESMTDGVILLDMNKQLVLINPAFSQFTGFSKKFFDIRNFYNFFPNLEIDKMLDLSLKKGDANRIPEVKIMGRFYQVFITPVRSNQQEVVGVAVILNDITSLKEIDNMKTEFVSVASHQLRTPLTAIKLFTEMLEKEQVGNLNQEQKEYMDDIHQSTDRMVLLVNDLLNITRIESGHLRIDPRPTDLGDLISIVLTEAKAGSVHKKIEFEFKNSITKKPKVSVDQNLIRQVVTNLLTNAIRYSNKDHGEIKITLSRKNSDYLVSVKDNGIGIPAKVSGRIFEKFFRADNAVRAATDGTGLGLYVSKMIVEMGGGDIWFETEENKGTTFYFTIPEKGMKKIEGEKGLSIS